MNTKDATITELAAGQWGLVSRRQAIKHKMPRGAIERRLEVGRWELIHDGVYRIAGAPATHDQRLLAACLAIGPEAVVSHRAAAARWGLIGATDLVEVTTTRLRSPEVEGAKVHRMADLAARWVRNDRGVPCTEVARTLVDLGAVMSAMTVERALDRALGRGLVSVNAVRTVVDAVAKRGRRGVGVIRPMLDERDGLEPPAGVLEARMATLLRGECIRTFVPEYEVWHDGRFVARVDFADPAARLAVEVDGYAAHSALDAFRRDRFRQNALVAAGWTVLRFTWREVDGLSPRVAIEIARTRARLAA